MAVKNQTHPETKLSTKSKSSEFSFNLLIKSTNFIFYSIKIRLEMAEIAIWLRKTKPNKPNRKPDQPNCPKPIKSLFMAVKNQTHPEIKLSTQSKSSEFSFNLLIKSTNFIFYSIKIWLEMAEIALWLRKTKPNKPNRKPDQPNRPKPIKSLFFVSWVCMPNFSFLGYA